MVSGGGGRLYYGSRIVKQQMRKHDVQSRFLSWERARKIFLKSKEWRESYIRMALCHYMYKELCQYLHSQLFQLSVLSIDSFLYVRLLFLQNVTNSVNISETMRNLFHGSYSQHNVVNRSTQRGKPVNTTW